MHDLIGPDRADCKTGDRDHQDQQIHHGVLCSSAVNWHRARRLSNAPFDDVQTCGKITHIQDFSHLAAGQVPEDDHR
jgi:hypothetical protein